MNLTRDKLLKKIMESKDGRKVAFRYSSKILSLREMIDIVIDAIDIDGFPHDIIVEIFFTDLIKLEKERFTEGVYTRVFNDALNRDEYTGPSSYYATKIYRFLSTYWGENPESRQAHIYNIL